MPVTSACNSKLVAMCVSDMLHRCSRFKSALGVVEHLLHSVREPNVWLAGYALGAAILVLVGKKMAGEEFCSQDIPIQSTVRDRAAGMYQVPQLKRQINDLSQVT